MNIEEIAFKDRKNLVQLNENDLLDIIEFLQNDRKQWINQFSKTHNESIDIQKEKQELKQKYLNAVADYETTMSELQELKKQIETYEDPKDLTLMFMYCDEKAKDKIRELKKQLEDKEERLERLRISAIGHAKRELDLEKQQKEFIKWLEDYLNLFDYRNIDEQAGYDMLEEILKKYKEIIGVLDEKK